MARCFFYLGREILHAGFSKASSCFHWASIFFRVGFGKARFCFNWAPKVYGEVLVRPVFALSWP